MAANSHLSSVEASLQPKTLYAYTPLCTCKCRTDFFRQEFEKHHQCLELQREYFSEGAIASAEQGVARILTQLEQICQREDATEIMCQLLRKLDVVTKLSAWTDPQHLH